GAKGAQPPHHYCSFQGTNDPAHEGTEHHKGADTGNKKEARPDQQAPEPAPKGPPFPPDLHAIAGSVVPNDVLFGVIILPHDRQFLDVAPRALEGFDRRFRLDMGRVNTNHCTVLSHACPPWGGLVLGASARAFWCAL